jgi:PDZ domain-containing secreted protein
MQSPKRRLCSRLQRHIVATILIIAVATISVVRLATVDTVYGSARASRAAMEYSGESRGTFLFLSRVERTAETPSEIAQAVLVGRFSATSSPSDRETIETLTEQGEYGSSTTSAQAADSAWAAANVAAGTPVETKPVVVVQHITGGNSTFAAGDRIVAVDGVAPWLRMLHKRLDSASTLLVARGDKVIELDAAGLTLNHTQLNDSVRLVHPRPPLVVREGTAGPSGGLIDALTYLDAITDGDLTGGLTVAGTGTITPDGKVGVIGAVDYKTEAAVRYDADVVFVPDANQDVARTTAGGNVTVVSVSSLAEAVSWLCRHGATSTACP